MLKEAYEKGQRAALEKLGSTRFGRELAKKLQSQAAEVFGKKIGDTPERLSMPKSFARFPYMSQRDRTFEAKTNPSSSYPAEIKRFKNRMSPAKELDADGHARSLRVRLGLFKNRNKPRLGLEKRRTPDSIKKKPPVNLPD